MSNILNTGVSGLLATKAALQLTSENISNVDTPGYHRRELLTEEVLPSGGVRITEVRRAFDGLLATRLREVGTASGAAEAFRSHAVAVESMMLPGPSGIASSLDNLFDAFDALAQNPDDAGLRSTLLLAGDAFAAQVNDLDAQLSRRAAGIEAERAMAVSDVNDLLDGLAKIELELANAVNIGSRNPLLDQRESVLGELARYVSLNVDTDSLGRVTVRLGSAENGPVLLERGKASHVDLSSDGRITVLPNDFGGTAVSVRPASGVLGGLAEAADFVAATRQDVDAWSARMASEINALHRQGITGDGEAGGAFFSTSGWNAEAGALTRGTVVPDIFVTDEDAMPEGPITLIYSSADGLWRAEDSTGATLAEGTDSLSLPGISISLSGSAWNGDRIALSSGGGEAGFFRMALSDPDAVAAGGALVVSADPMNSGDAELSVAPLPVSEATATMGAIPSLADALAMGDVVGFVSAGAVGFIPAGTESATLSTQPRYAATDFALPSGAKVSALSLTTGGTTYDFAAGAALDGDAFVAGLNEGSLLTASGESLTELGLVADFANGALTLLARDGSLPDASSLTTSGGVLAGVDVAAAADASDIAVFTREGRQIAGSPLTAAEAAALLTVANGFDPGAVYSTDGLGSDLAAPSVTRVANGGDYALQLPLPAGSGLTSFASGTVPPETSAQTLSVNTNAGPVEVALPAGASAAWASEILSDALPLSAQAETRLALDLPSTGELSFDVTGTNTTPAFVSVDLATGGPFALAEAINLQTASTGVRAEVSSDGSRFELIHDGGANITLSSLSHSGGATVDVTRLDPSGESLVSGTFGAAGADAIRIAGVVTLSGSADFSVLESGITTTAGQDGFVNGAIDLERSAAGSQVTLSPAEPVAGDLALREISVVGGDGNVWTATADPVLSGTQSLAEGLAASLRASAPASQLQGSALASLPPDGSVLVVSLGAQDYTITLQGGVPEVDGPEAGRVTASFDTSNRLIVETEGGHLDGAALQLDGAAGDALLFGMGPADNPTTTVIGQPFNASSLPSSFTVTVGGVSHAVTVNTSGVVLPPTFPGTGFINTAFGRVEIEFDAREGAFAIPADSAAADAGFSTMGAMADVQDGALSITATDGRNLAVSSTSAQDGTTLLLTEMPNEDLITVLSGAGANQLFGEVTEGETVDRARELRVLDAQAGLVGLFDAETGVQLAQRTLNAAGVMRFGNQEFTLLGTLSTGDSFTIAINEGAAGDGRTMSAIGDLRLTDQATGAGGFATAFAAIQQDVGAEVASSEIRQTTTDTALESAERAVSSLRDVDLDTEAARLIEQQQAYQANAQVIDVARTMFDTLLQSL